MKLPRKAEEKIISLYEDGMITSVIAKKFERSPCSIRYILKKHGVKLRPNNPRGNLVLCREVPPPTPEEIEQRSAEVRRGWSPEIEKARNNYKISPVTVTQCSGGDRRRKNKEGIY